jgi:hypothetical protein
LKFGPLPLGTDALGRDNVRLLTRLRLRAEPVRAVPDSSPTFDAVTILFVKSLRIKQ